MIKQLVVKIDNRPGTLMGCVGLLADNDIDIKAVELTDRGEGNYGIAHIIVSNLSKAIQALEKSNYPFEVEDVLVAEMDDRVGGLASILSVLRDEHINIHYLYAFGGRMYGKSLAVIRVDDLENAEHVLDKAGVPLISQIKIEARERGPITFKTTIEDHFGKTFIW